MIRDKHLGFRIDEELDYKLSFIAEYDGRSRAGEVIHLVRTGIREFEKEHGVIEMPQKP